MDRLQPLDTLREAVLLSIRKAEQRRAVVNFGVSLATLSVSLLGLISSVQYVGQVLYGSEFYNYTALIFSDLDSISRFWGDIVILLAESLPVFAITAVLVAVMVFLLSMRVMVNNTRVAFTFTT